MSLRSLFLRLVSMVFAFGSMPAARAAALEVPSWWESTVARWDERAAEARRSQPFWLSPLATGSSRLGQELRIDLQHQNLTNGGTLDVDGSGKGLSFIAARRVQVTFALPSYQTRRGPAPASGFADWAGPSLKYRMLSEPERTGNYVLTFVGQFGLPTGAAGFTNRNHVVTPTLAGGKGFGNFNVQATVGAAIPTRDHTRSGRAIATNAALQYHAGLLWPEIELNRTDWSGGRRDGRSQTYLTLGAILGRIPYGSRYRFSVGLGYQTALSRVYASGPVTPAFNHNWILSTRNSF